MNGYIQERSGNPIMCYSIKEASARTGLSIDTIRYYDKEGLLPRLERKPSGYRVFYDFDLEVLKIIQAFKGSGMQIKDIKRYMYMFMEGEATLQKRYEMVCEQRENLLQKQRDLDRALEELDKIIDYTKDAMNSDTEKEIRKRARELFEQKNKLS